MARDPLLRVIRPPITQPKIEYSCRFDREGWIYVLRDGRSMRISVAGGRQVVVRFRNESVAMDFIKACKHLDKTDRLS